MFSPLVLPLSYQRKEPARGFLRRRLELRRQRIEEAGIRLPRGDEALRLGLLEAQKLPYGLVLEQGEEKVG